MSFLFRVIRMAFSFMLLLAFFRSLRYLVVVGLLVGGWFAFMEGMPA